MQVEGSPAEEAADSTERFVAIFARSEAEIHTFILTLVPRWADADDVLQRTSIILWRKFDQWIPGTSFVAWACQIAKHEVQNFRRTQARMRVQFNDTLVDSLSQMRLEMADELAARREALQSCLSRLVPRDRDLIERCYGENTTTAKDVAIKLGRPVNTVYKALLRIRRALYECVQRHLATEGRT